MDLRESATFLVSFQTNMKNAVLRLNQISKYETDLIDLKKTKIHSEYMQDKKISKTNTTKILSLNKGLSEEILGLNKILSETFSYSLDKLRLKSYLSARSRETLKLLEKNKSKDEMSKLIKRGLKDGIHCVNDFDYMLRHAQIENRKILGILEKESKLISNLKDSKAIENYIKGYVSNERNSNDKLYYGDLITSVSAFVDINITNEFNREMNQKDISRKSSYLKSISSKLKIPLFAMIFILGSNVFAQGIPNASSLLAGGSSMSTMRTQMARPASQDIQDMYAKYGFVVDNMSAHLNILTIIGISNGSMTLSGTRNNYSVNGNAKFDEALFVKIINAYKGANGGSTVITAEKAEQFCEGYIISKLK